jgi:hypothetical protein
MSNAILISWNASNVALHLIKQFLQIFKRTEAFSNPAPLAWDPARCWSKASIHRKGAHLEMEYRLDTTVKWLLYVGQHNFCRLLEKPVEQM